MTEKSKLSDYRFRTVDKPEGGQKRILARPLILLVRVYQRFISPLFPARCKYYPSCSAYALECLEKHGVLKASLLSVWRLVRCNPFSMGGVDYPPQPGTWRAPSYHQMTDQELNAYWESLEVKNIR